MARRAVIAAIGSVAICALAKIATVAAAEIGKLGWKIVRVKSLP